jgi:hypothetical protein
VPKVSRLASIQVDSAAFDRTVRVDVDFALWKEQCGRAFQLSHEEFVMKPYCGRNVSSASLFPTNLSTHHLLLRHQSLTSYTTSSTPTTRPPDLQSTISSRLHTSMSSSYRIVFYLIVAKTTVSHNLTPKPTTPQPQGLHSTPTSTISIFISISTPSTLSLNPS